MGSFLTENGIDGMLHTLSVLIAKIVSLLGGSCDNVLPQSLELRIGQRVTVPVADHIFRC